MTQHYPDFEKPLAEIEGKAEELPAVARANPEMNVEKEAAALDRKAETLLRGCSGCKYKFILASAKQKFHF